MAQRAVSINFFPVSAVCLVTVPTGSADVPGPAFNFGRARAEIHRETAAFIVRELEDRHAVIGIELGGILEPAKIQAVVRLRPTCVRSPPCCVRAFPSEPRVWQARQPIERARTGFSDGEDKILVRRPLGEISFRAARRPLAEGEKMSATAT